MQIKNIVLIKTALLKIQKNLSLGLMKEVKLRSWIVCYTHIKYVMIEIVNTTQKMIVKVMNKRYFLRAIRQSLT